MADQSPKPTILDTNVQLTAGQLFYKDAKKQVQICPFQFNPTELERSRTVKFTRTPTGNILEEPDGGGRNKTKRKASRKPDPWEMTLSLRFDASHPVFAKAPPKPPPTSADEEARSAEIAASTTLPTPPDPPPATSFATRTATEGDASTHTKFKFEIERITKAMRFFEALAEPVPATTENQKIDNADETPPPPFVVLAFGWRAWRCAVKSVRIKEEDYTYDLYPRRFEVTLGLEIIETTLQNELGKLGGTR